MKLHALLQEFEGLEPDEALETLVEMAEELPPILPERAAAPFPADCRVRECQTPVHLWVDVEASGVRIEADVPRKSPTVRGLVSLVVQGLNGESPEAVLQAPDDLIDRLGLSQTLGMTRRNGLHGLIARIKREVARQTSGAK